MRDIFAPWLLPPQPPEDLSWQSAIATMHHRASTGEMKMHAVPRKAPIGGKWSKEEDDKLKEIVQENGIACNGWKPTVQHTRSGKQPPY